MTDFTKETYQNILADMLKRIPDTYDKRDTSPIPTALGPAAYALEGFYLTLNQVQQTAFVQTATGMALDYLSAVGGISRYPASKAVRLGVFNTAVPIGSRFSTVNGADSINFTVTANTETTNQYKLTAETPGSIGNEYFGAILPITTIPGLTDARITDILIPGDDEETDSELRTRLVSALNDRPFGGNIAAFRENILAIDGVGAVQVYPTWNGGGTVKCSILGANFLPASAELIESVQNAVDPPPNQGLGLGFAPIGAKVTITTPDTVTVNVSAKVTLAQGYTLQQVQTPIETEIGAYLQQVRENWAVNTSGGAVTYAADVYIARITAAIVGTSGVVNATDIQINGVAEDLMLVETGQTQQVPVLGAVTLSESN